jgi:hypothetical protein
MAGGEFRVEGGRKLRATLKAAGDDLTDLKQANKDAAEIAARASAALAPEVSGKLRRTIRAAGTKSAGIIRAGTKAVPYGPAVHWGRLWWPNKQASPRHISKVRPQPFLSDGATSSEGRWLPVYEKQLEEIISRIEGATP